MTEQNILTGHLLEEIALTLDELAQACAVAPDWVVKHVEAGMLGSTQASARWVFVSADLVRARRLVSYERGFDANDELAALVVDLIEEVEQLKHRLKMVGFETDKS
ncbi:MAG: chaperone modulator CbpM [Methylophilaceae bacterium]